jgi:hypothetical protein
MYMKLDLVKFYSHITGCLSFGRENFHLAFKAHSLPS